MKKKSVARRILFYQFAGFVVVLAILWLDEIFDFPHAVFDMPATPVNWAESTIETLLVVFLGIFVMCATHRLLMRIRYLEGFLRICSFCKKIRVGGEWVPIEDYITEHSASQFSHGLCDACLKEHYGDFLKKKGRQEGSDR